VLKLKYDKLKKMEVTMEVNKRKDDLVKLLLNKEFDIKDEDELVEMLLDSPIAIDSDKEEDAKRSLGDKLADKVTAVAGSWGFIIVFCIFLILWMIINYLMIVNVDPYPFILLNLILSCIAALQAPIIMMSQNRAAKKDSLRSLNDYKTDLKSDDERERKKERNERMEKGGKGERMHGQKECEQTSRERQEDKKTKQRVGKE
jgi:uncharacterized membrane protein